MAPNDFSSVASSNAAYDVLIVGAGPAGLSLALQLQHSLPAAAALRIGLVEQAPRSSLEAPAFDGREIALTQHSVALLQQWGVWQRIPAQAKSPLKDALVMDGDDPFAMTISHRDAPVQRSHAPQELGFLVANHHIRQALWDALSPSLEPASPMPHVQTTLLADSSVHAVDVQADGAVVELADGRRLHTQLLVAADSRHSGVRRALGLAADMHDFGRSMLVCTMRHERDHAHQAWEWFGYGQTLALLPMNPCSETGMPRSSVVLTLPAAQMRPVEHMDDARFNADMQQRFAGRLGAMALCSTRHVYPLVAVYPRRLVGPRLACVGDAACGMHPVTAHGFNLGLRSVEHLAHALVQSWSQGRGVADAHALARYERAQRMSSQPTFIATQAITHLYTSEHAAARLLRRAALRVGQHLPLFRRAVAASLTGR
ncbi:5-demethoxyubiquinol-8 5-hydroxylase UbiM [Curvibacter sp. CHRR-16]|uniref:5-demethoxyubiquinol-8 5-hydroxylase UbiM n=1 Tax=Curvibacter sp. CHRR-16 TaxID=2835872 RepID=UPI001BDA6758|nr:5-demethoxyubiquinol-8 5-hydroxylase UbiM [Curvibacter sp. CHRR-16]MBT0569769.1 5-demethoxyubiquinol-8 5-hydroxylase UbiM [Curvibacter sp. CHRR-16]